MPIDAKVLAGVLGETYIDLLGHPVDVWRISHQRTLARLRDALAAYTGLSPEEVQNTYEDIANAYLRIPLPEV